MSDRTPRPEWRAAYLNRTLPGQALRGSAGRGTARFARDRHAAPQRGGARPADATPASFPMSITAMLHLVPTA